MKQFGIIVSLVILILPLAVSASAMRDKGALATCLGFATTDASRITNPGNGSVKIVYTPSLFEGFSSQKYIYLEGDETEARTTASQIMGFGIKNLTARVYKGTMKSGDLKVKIVTKRTNGNEGMSNSLSSSASSSYSSSNRRGGYSTSGSSNIGSSSSMDATALYIRSEFSLELMVADGQMDVVPVSNIPVGGADSATTNQRSSDNSSSSRGYSSSTSRRGGHSSGSSYSSSSASSSSSYRSPEIAQAIMSDRISDRSRGNLAALIVDAITMAGLSGQILGAIFETKAPQTTLPVSQGQDIYTPLR